MGMGWPQQLDVRLDGELLKRFTVGGDATGHGRPPASYAGDGEPGLPATRNGKSTCRSTADAGLEVRVPVKAGPHVVGVVVRPGAVGAGRPAAAAAARPRADERPALHGLRAASARCRSAARTRRAAAGADTPSRRAIFVCRAAPGGRGRARVRRRRSSRARPARLPPSARRRRTCRRCSSSSTRGRREGGSFDAGIQFALERLLVDPDFLLRVDRDPGQRGAADAYRLSDLELASRLSFFLWSSIPDERCSTLAERGQLTRAGRPASSRCGACWPTRAPSARSSTTSPRSG